MNKHDRMYERIRKHGENLLAIFPNVTEPDPVKLCKKLRRIEAEGERHALAMCNDAHYCSDYDKLEQIADKIRDKANKLLGTNRIRLNQDPRGYALKVDLKPGEHLHTDWGGYGIIAPDLSEG